MSSSSNYYSPNNAMLGSDISRVSSPELLSIQQQRSNGATSPTPSTRSSLGGFRTPTPSKRDRIRSKHPPPVHVSKLESVIGKEKGQSIKPEAGVTTDIGIAAEEVYDEYLPETIGWIRRKLVRSLKIESEWLAWHQPLVRTPFLDRFFVYTSLFGTHSFFLIFLPAAFWVGSPYFARGLVNTLAFGVYFSSAIKDTFCVPRPFSPPVTRLTVGSTHLEYGFPSTHSTNSVGTALYIYLWVLAWRQRAPVDGWEASWWWDAGLAFYAFSVVYGRVYAGMHSVMDCAAGSLLGALITLAQWYGFDFIESFLSVPGYTVPVVMTSACLLLVFVHPEPLDDCPCFEDAIAFISVVLGTSLGRWASLRYEALRYDGDVNPLLPAEVSSSAHIPVASTWQQMLHASGRNTLAVLVGVLMIFSVRVVAKTSCKLILPRIFRFVDNAFGLVLPRRHYVPSSEYTDVPMNNIIRSPSFMDLPSTLTPMASGGPEEAGAATATATSTGLHSRRDTSSDLSHRSPLTGPSRDASSSGGSTMISRPHSPSIQVNGDEEIVRAASPPSLPSLASRLQEDRGSGKEPNLVQFPPSPQSSLSVPFTHSITQGGALLPGDALANKVAAELSPDERKRQEALASGQVMHYDIDVLTKVIVYANIGFWAASPIPTFLRWVGLL